MEELECYSCDAVFFVEHDLNEDYYKVTHCPFCGTTIVDEEITWNDEDWDE